LAWPSSPRVDVIELERPRSSLISFATGEGGDVAQHGLAAITETRCLDRGSTLSTPRRRLTTKAARASPSTSSAMTRNGLPLEAMLVDQRNEGRARLEIFFSKTSTYGVFQHALQRPGIGHEVR
jgi:hypothetical protein